MTDRNEWNRCRYRQGSEAGHYESYFQRANHPTRPLAFWVRYTIFSPAGQPGSAVGELWAIWFDGETGTVTAVKREEPIAACAFSDSGLSADVGGAMLSDGQLAGDATHAGHCLRWELSYQGSEPPLLLLPRRLYRIGFPKAKALVGTPNAVYRGWFEVDGERKQIDGWVGSQNHNWGSQHTDRYAWGQVASFDDEPNSFLECGSAKLRFGPVWSPTMTVIVLQLDGERYLLNNLGRAMRARATIRYFEWQFASEARGVQVEGKIVAPRSTFVGLRYNNPPGGWKSCLNSKLASCELTLRRPGQAPKVLRSEHRAAFEILTDDLDHGVPIVA